MNINPMPNIVKKDQWLSHSMTARRAIKAAPIYTRFVYSRSLQLDASLGLRTETLRTANKIARQKNEHAAHNDLKSRLQEGSIHIAMPDVADGTEFNRYNNHGERGRHAKMGNQKGQSMSKSSSRGHQSCSHSANPWRSSARK